MVSGDPVRKTPPSSVVILGIDYPGHVSLKSCAYDSKRQENNLNSIRVGNPYIVAGVTVQPYGDACVLHLELRLFVGSGR